MSKKKELAPGTDRDRAQSTSAKGQDIEKRTIKTKPAEKQMACERGHTTETGYSGGPASASSEAEIKRRDYSLTIELTAVQKAALEAEASARGLALSEFARLRLLEAVSAAGSSPGRKLHGYGVLAGVGGSVDDFLREKHADIA